MAGIFLRRKLVTLVFAVVAALVFTASPASAEASTVPPQGVHTCTVVGWAVKGYEAVVCADIVVTADYNYGNNFDVTGSIEAYCQTVAGQTVQCANIDAQGAFGSASLGILYGPTYNCGHSYGPCPTGRADIVQGTFSYWVHDDCSLPAYNVWTTVLGDNTEIELPVSDSLMQLNAGTGGNDGINFSTGHYQACPLD
jgi:hypothetical protein